jgi:hypothetical protein
MKKLSVVLLLFCIGILFLSLRTTKINDMNPGGFTPLSHDELAKKHVPRVLASSVEELPVQLFYRACMENSSGNIFIFYHFFWEKEENKTSGFFPFLSRSLYTGGLGLQKIIFGVGDIELVVIELNSKGDILGVEYETGENYAPGHFSVKHKTMRLSKNLEPPFYFRVATWNHLFDFIPHRDKETEVLETVLIEPKYFSDDEWKKYTMVKEKETFFKRSRAHKPCERLSL